MNGGSFGKDHIINKLIECQRAINEAARKAGATTQESEKARVMFENLFESSPDALILIDLQSRILRVNRETEKLFGYERQELVGMEHAMLVPERFMEKHDREVDEYVKHPRVRVMGVGLQLWGQKKDGTEFPADIDLGPIMINDQQCVLAVVRDASRRRHLEDELDSYRQRLESIVAQRTAEFAKVNANLEHEMQEHRKTEEGMNLRATILDNADEAVFLINEQGSFIYANQAATNLYGYSLAEFLGINATQLARPEEAAALTARIKSVYQKGHMELEVIHVHKDGSIMPVHARHTLTQTKYGEFLVTEVRKVARESDLRVMFGAMPGIIWATDLNLKLLSCGGATIAELGLKSERYAGQLLMEFLSEHNLDSSIFDAQEKALGGKSTPIMVKTKNGTFEGWTAPMLNEKYEIMGTVGVLLNTPLPPAKAPEN